VALSLGSKGERVGVDWLCLGGGGGDGGRFLLLHGRWWRPGAIIQSIRSFTRGLLQMREGGREGRKERTLLETRC